MQRVAVVTGGANGIGRCIADKFLEQDYAVAIIDMDQEKGELFAAAYPERGYFMKGDITDQGVLDHFVQEVKTRYGRVDVLVNNACVGKGGIFNASYEEFNYVLRLGVTAPFYLSQQLLPLFQEGGSIINISSTRAFQSQSNTESYTAAKGGISALTHALSVSLASHHIRVNAINPGWIDSDSYLKQDEEKARYSVSDREQHSAGRVGRPEDIAEMVLFLASDKAGFITGEDITIDGGMSRLMIYHDDYGWTYKRPE